MLRAQNGNGQQSQSHESKGGTVDPLTQSLTSAIPSGGAVLPDGIILLKIITYFYDQAHFLQSVIEEIKLKERQN